MLHLPCLLNARKFSPPPSPNFGLARLSEPNPSYLTSKLSKPRKDSPKKPLSVLTEPKEVSNSNLEHTWKLNNEIPYFVVEGLPRSSIKVEHKLQHLVSEFQSLREPVDRVKRLLHYATLLPPFEDSGRVAQNKVTGCTTQVWLEVKMEADRSMRFRVDSDSEITKGFCSCLVWLFDGAAPEEVMAVRGEDLVDMNVGLSGRTRSRVNTWHNVLISMQKRTEDLVNREEALV